MDQDRISDVTGQLFFLLLGLACLGAVLLWRIDPLTTIDPEQLVVQAKATPQNLMISVTNLGRHSLFVIGSCGKFGGFTGLQAPSYSACGSEAIEVEPQETISSLWALESIKAAPGVEPRACITFAATRWSTRRQELCTTLQPI